MAGWWTVTLIMLFSINLMLWLGTGGYCESGLLEILSGSFDWKDLISSFFDLKYLPETLLLLFAGVGVAALFSGGSNYSVIYIVPTIIISVLLMKFFLFPYKCLQGIEYPVDIIIRAFFNLLILITVVSFITGRE